MQVATGGAESETSTLNGCPSNFPGPSLTHYKYHLRESSFLLSSPVWPTCNLWTLLNRLASMPSDDSQNLSCRDYDDQGDEETLSAFGESSPGRSDEVFVVQPVERRLAKEPLAIRTKPAPTRVPPKNKSHRDQGISARPVGPSVSKPNLTSGKFIYLDPCGAYGTPVEVSVKEEEQSSHGEKTSKSLKVVFKKKSTASSGEQHAGDRPPVSSRPSGSSVAPVQTRSSGKRPMGETEIEVPELAPATDPKRPRVTGEEILFTDILNRGSVSISEMFNVMFQYVPPPVAHSSVELFIRSRSADAERDEELKMLREEVKKYEAALRSWEQYPGSAQFHKDAVAYFANRPAALPDLVASALPLFQTLQRDPVGLKMLRREAAWGYSRGKETMQVLLHRALEEAVQPETWEELRAMLPKDVAPPGLEPFTDPATGPTDPSSAASRNQDPK
nr:uncharacterized protein LOC109149872 [Ipomoea batatas]